MKRWAIVTILLYILVFAVITVPILTLSFIPVKFTKGVPAIQMREIPRTFSESLGAFKAWCFWALLVTMTLCSIALLATPVGIAERRPTSTRSLIWPVLASGFAMALLAGGAFVSIGEFFLRDKEATAVMLLTLGGDDDGVNLGRLFAHRQLQIALGIMAFTWILWALIFFRSSRRMEPRNFIERQCRYLYAGSVLELLVAVPCHVVARSRDYCCAGFSTFMGIMFGISVMLLSFGPGIFFLYTDRWQRLHPKKG